MVALSIAFFLSSSAEPQSSPSPPAHGALLMRPDSAGRPRYVRPSPVPAALDTGYLENEPPEPGASYGTFATARESLAVLFRRTMGGCADSARWVRARTRFLYIDKLTLEHTIAGRPYWSIERRDSSVAVPSLVVSLTTARGDCPGPEVLAEAFRGAGWVENARYGSDGADGTSFAYFCREALCNVEMAWEGEDESDTTYVPKPGFSLTLTCVPRPREDPAMKRVRR
jgi:hypothetical protein